MAVQPGSQAKMTSIFSRIASLFKAAQENVIEQLFLRTAMDLQQAY